MIEALFPIETAIAWGNTVTALRELLGREEEEVAPEPPFQAKYMSSRISAVGDWYDDEPSMGGGSGRYSDGIIQGWR